MLKIRVDKDGGVVATEVVRSTLPSVTAAVQEAVAQWKFVPQKAIEPNELGIEFYQAFSFSS